MRDDLEGAISPESLCLVGLSDKPVNPLARSLKAPSGRDYSSRGRNESLESWDQAPQRRGSNAHREYCAADNFSRIRAGDLTEQGTME